MNVLEAVERGDERWELREDTHGREYAVWLGEGRMPVGTYNRVKNTTSLDGKIPEMVNV